MPDFAPLVALLFAGGIIATVLVYGLFINKSFFDQISHPDHARGLITFMFSFVTIGIIVVVAIAILWMDEAEVTARFGHAKDLITILVGVLGTIIGFYFGTASSTRQVTPGTPSVSAVAVSPSSATAGSKIKVSGKISGGVSPYQYTIVFGGNAKGIDISKLDIKSKYSATGDIAEEVSTPAEAREPAQLTAKVVANDARGTPAESSEVGFALSPH